MDALATVAASGLRARMESLDLLANNIANATTGGYKADREFYGLYASAEALAENGGVATAPVIERRWTDFSQGVLRQTGNALDFALDGKGFFAVNGPAGPLYTRNGSFRVTPAGLLTTADGYAVRTVSTGPPRPLGPSRPIEVSADGSIRQDGEVLARLEVVEMETSALDKSGRNYFRLADPSARPAPAAAVAVHQGKLEDSNASGAEGAVRLVSVMRQFEMLQKAVSLGAEMNRRALEEVARVNP